MQTGEILLEFPLPKLVQTPDICGFGDQRAGNANETGLKGVEQQMKKQETSRSCDEHEKHLFFSGWSSAIFDEALLRTVGARRI